MEVFLAAVVVLGIGIFGMCFNIIFRKDGEFPEYEVSANKEMRKLGIRCMREQDDMIFESKDKPRHKDCAGSEDEACKGCALYKTESK